MCVNCVQCIYAVQVIDTVSCAYVLRWAVVRRHMKHCLLPIAQIVECLALQLASCVHVCCSYSWASCMQTIHVLRKRFFYIPKKNRSHNFFFPGRLFKFPGRIALRPRCILRVVIYLYFSWILLLVHTHTKNLPIPDVTLKNRGSEMIGKKSKNRPINRDRRSDLAALVTTNCHKYKLPPPSYTQFTTINAQPCSCWFCVYNQTI